MHYQYNLVYFFPLHSSEIEMQNLQKCLWSGRLNFKITSVSASMHFYVSSISDEKNSRTEPKEAKSDFWAISASYLMGKKVSVEVQKENKPEVPGSCITCHWVWCKICRLFQHQSGENKKEIKKKAINKSIFNSIKDNSKQLPYNVFYMNTGVLKLIWFGFVNNE